MKRAPEVRASWRGESGGMSPQKILKSRGSEMLFTAFYTRYLVKKSISIKCNMTGIFRACSNIYEVLLIA